MKTKKCTKKQSKATSFLEASLNALSSLLTAYITWAWIIIPWTLMLNLDANNFTFVQIMLVNSAFTVVGLLKSYFWRRLFNKLN